mgnify:CR=1 FL=1
MIMQVKCCYAGQKQSQDAPICQEGAHKTTHNIALAVSKGSSTTENSLKNTNPTPKKKSPKTNKKKTSPKKKKNAGWIDKVHL